MCIRDRSKPVESRRRTYFTLKSEQLKRALREIDSDFKKWLDDVKITVKNNINLIRTIKLR